jgi:hypothetical protein
VQNVPNGSDIRSSFRDWVGETTEYSFEVAEAALAHTPQSKVVAAYARGDLFEKRARMMQGWAQYVVSACKLNHRLSARAYAFTVLPLAIKCCITATPQSLLLSDMPDNKMPRC